jgi:bacteriochlorophyll 4-vinyl reductase
MAAPVDALLPLSLLEGVRAVDRPIEDPETEFVAELRNKRLGLSDTVLAQIRRYAEAVRRGQRAAPDEVTALARLIDRRPDAETVYQEAGRFLATYAYQALGAASRRSVRSLPRFVARPLAARQARRIARRYLGGRVERAGTSLVLEVPRPLTVGGGSDAPGCAFYAAGFAELLRLLVGQTEAVEHERCSVRGDGRCRWRVEWPR